ncbi:MAG: helix-turn-helix domain-containing protein [Myxococcota bacterium]
MDATRGRAYGRFLVRLRTAREEAGMTQVEAARRLRRDQAFVSKSETGDRRVDVMELQAFARLYGKPVQYFFDPS